MEDYFRSKSWNGVHINKGFIYVLYIYIYNYGGVLIFVNTSPPAGCRGVCINGRPAIKLPWKQKGPAKTCNYIYIYIRIYLYIYIYIYNYIGVFFIHQLIRSLMWSYICEAAEGPEAWLTARLVLLYLLAGFCLFARGFSNHGVGSSPGGSKEATFALTEGWIRHCSGVGSLALAKARALCLLVPTWRPKAPGEDKL